MVFSSERMFKGQFVATRGIHPDPELEHRKGTQFQRLTNDLRSRLDHLLNTSRWSGRFLRSELLFVEPIFSKEKINLTLERSKHEHTIDGSRSINKFAANDWLISIQEHAIANHPKLDDELGSIDYSASDSPLPGTHWLHFRLYFIDIPTNFVKSASAHPGPSASDLYLLLSEELIRQPSGLFARYGVTQSSLSIAERVPTISALAQLHLLWQWMRSPKGQWPSLAMFSRKTQQKLNRAVTSISSAASALQSTESLSTGSQQSSSQFIHSLPDQSTVQHFSDGSSVHQLLSDQFQSFSHCEPLKVSMCDFLPYQSVFYPNLLGHRNHSEIEQNLLEYRQMIDAECDPAARQLLCTLLQPPCRQPGVSGAAQKSQTVQTLLYSSETRVQTRWKQNCVRMSERILNACRDWAPKSLITRLRIAVDKPDVAFGTHAELVCSVGESECVQRLRNSNQNRNLCDHINDCEDGSDEQNCDPEACKHMQADDIRNDFGAIEKQPSSAFGQKRGPTTATEPNFIQWFDCGSRCIPMSQRCDQQIQCENGMDELRCLHQEKGTKQVMFSHSAN